MICKHCGNPQPEDALVCPFCGQRVERHLGVPPNAEPSAYQQHPAPPPRKKNRKLLTYLIVGGALLLVVLVSVLILRGRGNDTSSSKKWSSGSSANASSGAATTQAPMVLPVPGAGEVLYVGDGAMPNTDKFTVAFIRSADGSEVHDVTLHADNLSLTFEKDGISSEISTTIQSSFSGVYPVRSSGVTLIDLGGSRITNLTFSAANATGHIDFIYHHSGSGGALGSVSQDIPVGSCTILFAAQGDALKTPSQPDAASHSVPVTSPTSNTQLDIEGTFYDISIADVFYDESEGETTVHLSIPALDGTIVVRENGMIIMAQASIAVNGEVLSFDSVNNSGDMVRFYFPTKELPDTIYIYAHTGGYDQPGTFVFDGQGNLIDVVK